MFKADAFLKMTREIILDSFQIFDDRIEFDGAKAQEAGHDPMDVCVVENIFMNECYFTDRFRDNLKVYYSNTEINNEPDFEPIAFYIPVAKIIFVINLKENVSSHIFEEDLIKETAIIESAMKFFDTYYPDCDTNRKKVEYKW